MLQVSKFINSALMFTALTAFSTAAVSGPKDYEKLPIKAGTLYYQSQTLPNGNVLVKDIWVLNTEHSGFVQVHGAQETKYMHSFAKNAI